jgi:hypothetical protein
LLGVENSFNVKYQGNIDAIETTNIE